MMLEKNMEYIINYIDKNYFCVYELKDYNLKDCLTRKIINAMRNVDYSSGQYDFFVDSVIGKEMKSLKSISYERLINVKNHVYLIMNYYKTFNNIEISSFKSLQLTITKLLISRYNYDEIMNGKYDELIKKYMYLKDETLSEETKIRESVSEYIKQNGTYIEEDMESVVKLSKELIDSGYNTEQVKNGFCDSFMDLYSTKDAIKRNSIESKNESINKIPLKEKNSSKSLRTQALTLAIAVSVFAGAYLFGNSNANNPSIKDTLIEISTTFDDYEYPKIYGESSSEFSETCTHIIYKFSDYAQYGEKFGQLCLLKGFKSIETDPYYAMDVVMNIAQESAKNIEDLEGISDEVSPYSCYPIYVYSKLKEAGIDVEKNERITKAVKNYDKQTCNYKQFYPYSALQEEDKKSLDKMMRIYEDYCESLNIELAKKMNETKGAK